MNSLSVPPRSSESTPTGAGPVLSILRPIGRFAVHGFEMCLVMCAGAIGLNVVFFGAARLLGYTGLPDRAPALSALVVAVNFTLPMLVWMRWRGMPWRPTLEMSGAPIAVGLTVILGYGLDLVARHNLIEVQAKLACPVMIAVMLTRFRLYARPHGRAAHD